MVEDVLAIALIFGGGTLFLLAISPIGRAIAERIRPRAPAEPDGHAQEALLDEIHQLRQDVSELAERVDFMERLQAKPRDPARLGPPA